MEPQAIKGFSLASESHQRPNLPISSRRLASFEVPDPFATTILEAVVVQTKLTDQWFLHDTKKAAEQLCEVFGGWMLGACAGTRGISFLESRHKHPTAASLGVSTSIFGRCEVESFFKHATRRRFLSWRRERRARSVVAGETAPAECEKAGTLAHTRLLVGFIWTVSLRRPRWAQRRLPSFHFSLDVGAPKGEVVGMAFAVHPATAQSF